MMASASARKRIAQVDGRTVLFLTICACLVSFLTTDLLGHALFTCGLALMLCFFGCYKQGIGYFAAYLACVLGLYYEAKVGLSFPSPLLLSMLYKLLLPAMPAYLLFRMPSVKLTASLRKLPIPSKAMLVLMVMLRFAPTVILEFKGVCEAMKMRGFLRSPWAVLRHPLNTLEYAIVPMVFRALKIADELSASAIVRGIESPYKKQSYYLSRIGGMDAGIIGITVALAVVCCLVM
ncbi:MAG: energy-coupling factor transporter transmembrane component T [Peptococcaceae bacterium]|nr:energy-coupling factor transporter transmembrane component T [Peptococcaceae bacterium]